MLCLQVFIIYKDVDKFDNVCKDIELNFKEAERMLKQMDLEITTNSALDKNKTKNTYSGYKKKFDDYKSKYFKIKESYTYTKKMEEMINNSQNESEINLNINSSQIGLQTQQMYKNENLISKSSENLENAKRAALGIENVSKNVMIDLENQSQLLNSTNSKLVMLNKTIDNSRSIITKMMNRENRNKSIIAVFSVTLLTFFLFILSSRS
jgi:hypothetical protein